MDSAQMEAVNMIEEIYKSFTDIGYEITHRELVAADYGTPQKRRRLFCSCKEITLFSVSIPYALRNKKLTRASLILSRRRSYYKSSPCKNCSQSQRK